MLVYQRVTNVQSDKIYQILSGSWFHHVPSMSIWTTFQLAARRRGYARHVVWRHPSDLARRPARFSRNLWRSDIRHHNSRH
jgi:hypothetical protein